MTEFFVPESPPLMQTQDGRILAEYLNRQMLSISSFLKATYAGHAGLYLETSFVASINITAIPSKITGFDSQQSGETGALSILANDTIQFLETGVWVVGIQIVAEVTPSTANSAREVAIQFYDETDAVALDVIANSSIPRYGESLTLSGVIMVDIKDTGLNHEFSLYAYSPSGDTIAVEAVSVMDYFAFRVSNYTHTGV